MALMKWLTGNTKQPTLATERRNELTGNTHEDNHRLARVLLWGFNAFSDLIWTCMLLGLGLMAAASMHAGHELSESELTDFLVAAFHWVTAGLH